MQTDEWQKLHGQVECSCGKITIVSFDHKGDFSDDPDQCARLIVRFIRTKCWFCGLKLKGEKFTKRMIKEKSHFWVDELKTGKEMTE